MQHSFKKFKSFSQSLFISFEGIEGSGKTTQIQFLKTYFENKGYKVLLLREPGGTVFGERLRTAILESNSPIDPLAEAHLFASSRAQLLSEKILPHLSQEKSVVLLDRYLDSSIAYQGVARGLGVQTIIDLHSHKPLNIVPNKTFYLKIDIETSMDRQNARGAEKDYFEKEEKSFYQNLIDGYDQASELFSDRIEIIDAKRELEAIRLDIEKSVAAL